MHTAEEILANKGTRMITVDEKTVLCEAIKTMKKEKIGAILVTSKDRIAGIWTERDLMKRCLDKEFDLNSSQISEHMTRNLIVAEHTETLYELLDKFLGKRIRHLPVKKGDRIIGLISTGDVIRAAMAAKDRELKNLNAMVSWEYYENWRWSDTKKAPVIHNEEGLRVDLNPVD